MKFKASLVICAAMVILSASAASSQTCTYNFSTGKGLGYLQYCITQTGTFSNFQSPANVEMLNQGFAGEGYGICDLSGNYPYWDYGDSGNSGNWAAPNLVSLTSSQVKISRSTADGRWT